MGHLPERDFFLIDDRAQHGLCGVFDAFERNLVQFERNLTMLVELRLEMRRHQDDAVGR